MEAVELVWTENKREMTMIKLALVSALLLATPFEAVAAKVRVKLIDQDKKTVTKPESKLIGKNAGKEYFGKVNKKGEAEFDKVDPGEYQDRKSTRLNSSHLGISYAVFCLKK